jgi:pimeloyl-ACP methyl ester carboxylesterase
MTSLQNADPRVVLVHGAYADGSSWAQVIRLLHGARITATAVQNPLTSLADDVEHTRWVLAQQPGPVILAGHSFAGTVISQAGTHPAVPGWSMSPRGHPMRARTTPRWPAGSRPRWPAQAWSTPTGSAP